MATGIAMVLDHQAINVVFVGGYFVKSPSTVFHGPVDKPDGTVLAWDYGPDLAGHFYTSYEVVERPEQKAIIMALRDKDRVAPSEIFDDGVLRKEVA